MDRQKTILSQYGKKKIWGKKLVRVLNPLVQNHIRAQVVDFFIAGHKCQAKKKQPRERQLGCETHRLLVWPWHDSLHPSVAWLLLWSYSRQNMPWLTTTTIASTCNESEHLVKYCPIACLQSSMICPCQVEPRYVARLIQYLASSCSDCDWLTTFTGHVLKHGDWACALGRCHARSRTNKYNRYKHIYTASSFLCIRGSLRLALN